jgi:hypothetical protein
VRRECERTVQVVEAYWRCTVVALVELCDYQLQNEMWSKVQLTSGRFMHQFVFSTWLQWLGNRLALVLIL